MPVPATLEILVNFPTPGAAVARDYVEGVPMAVSFFGAHFTDPGAYVAKAAEVDRRFDPAARRRAAQGMVVPPGGDPDRVRRWVDEGGYVVTTGQQPGLFGGPLYSIYKGVTAIRLAACLEERLGRPVLPLFWVASEDHDWEEANHTRILGMDNELHLASLPQPDPGRRPPLHRIRCGPQVDTLLSGFLERLPTSDFSSPFVELLRREVHPDSTLPGAFAGILGGVLGRHGLILTDAAHPAVKGATQGLLLEELERAEEMEGILAGTARRLEAAGYGVQAALLDGGVNMFLDGPLGRERLYRDAGGFRLRASGTSLGVAEIRARVHEDPTALSPNVLLRPVVESAAFPTLTYVAGPGEIAYFAQLEGYFRAHGMQMPVVHPRHGAVLLERKIRKVLDKFGLDVSALGRPFHEVAGAIARDEVPQPIRQAMDALRGAVAKGTGELQEAVGGVDPTLKGPVQHVRSQAFSALDELERKVLQALKRENEIALSQLEKAQLHLFPLGSPQERVLNPFYYLMRYGGGLVDELVHRCTLNLTGGTDVSG